MGMLEIAPGIVDDDEAHAVYDYLQTVQPSQP